MHVPPLPNTIASCAILIAFFVRSFNSLSTDEMIDSTEEIAAFSNTTPNGVRREGIDTSLRKYAFMALSHARTGIIYNVSLPPSLNGISAQVMRVRSGSARRRGLVFNEFVIPLGVVVVTGGPFVIMIYRNIFNFTVYSLPQGYSFVSPILGIVIYTNLNTSFDDTPLPEMNVVSAITPITARVPLSQPIGSSVPLCAFFDINGTVTFLNLSEAPNVCSSTSLQDVALVLPSSLIPPPPASPSPTPFTTIASRKSASNVWKMALVAVSGGVVGLAILIAVLILGLRVRDKCKIAVMEELGDNEEALQTSLVGNTRAPTAAGLRTRPTLETGSLHTGVG